MQHADHGHHADHADADHAAAFSLLHPHAQAAPTA